MGVSESQKKSRDKWDKANMSVLGCKVKKEQAENPIKSRHNFKTH